MVTYLICAIIATLLSIILFFKVWGMCNDVRKLRKHFCGSEDDSEDENIKTRILAGDDSAVNDLNKQLAAELGALAKKAQGMIEEDYVRAYGTSPTVEIKEIIDEYKHRYSEMGLEFPADLAKVKTIEDLWELPF